jgi:glycerol-3-phosphate O-acyltransferase
VVSEDTVYEEANKASRELMDKIVADHLLPKSRFEYADQVEYFLKEIRGGKSGLILAEHYSNLDLPVICYLLEHSAGDAGRELSERIVTISGKKLNETNLVVRAWSEGFTRIVIYPSRSIAGVEDPEEVARAKKINMAATRAIFEAKKRGQVILLFPTGTRYRPGKPETKRGVREVDSYLRMFDLMLLFTINGLVLRFSKEDPENMLADRFYKDTMIVRSSPVMDCRLFRKAIAEEWEGTDVDLKQAASDRIMEHLEDQHRAVERDINARKFAYSR